ncbi:hypothetical protein LCGC14_0531360 [marine sediment metagenome]|uniref:Uncharacterized protein n=1 Tax=marine sediment metagenome TaxID=412755 RepID=A0A0F9RVL3_9ZZZZ
MTENPIIEYNLLEVLNVEKQNVSPTGLTQFQITRFGNTYKDPLIKNKRENFWERVDRFEVTLNDPGMIAISGRYIDETMSKLPKCYEVDEGGEPIEVMADVWEKWETLNIAEMFKDIAGKMLDDGYCIGRRYVVDNQIGYKAYGFFESNPIFWHRINAPHDVISHNKIWKYDVFYIPVPQGSNNLNTYNIMEVRDILNPADPTVYHYTRGKFNHGIGESRIQGIWDPITKLRKTSHADYHRSSIFPIFEYPEEWDGEEFLPDMIDKIRRVDEVEGLAIAKYKNEQTGEITEFPRFWERTFAESPGQAKADASSGGSLLRNAEYARILMALGYSETYFVGNQPGAVEGSKLDLTRDDRVDIREFQHYIKLIKDTNLWLLEVGAFDGISPESIEFIMNGNYNIMHHLEWTVLENNLAAAEMAEDQAESEGDDIERQNAIDFKMNSMIEEMVIYALKNNQNFPTTPVSSTWISHIAVRGKDLFMKIPGWDKGPWAGYRFESADIAGMKGREMASSDSKGGWVWDNIWGPGTKPFSKGPRPTRAGINEDISGIIFSNNPFGEEATVQGMGEGTFEERKKALLEPGKGLIGTEKTRRPLLQTPTTPTIQPQTPGIMEGPLSKFTPFEESRMEGFTTAPHAQVATSGRVVDPKSITGSKKIGPGAKRKRGPKSGPSPTPSIVPFNITNSAPDISQLSYKRYNALALEVFGEGIGNKTWQKQRKIQDHLKLHYQLKFNNLAVGNVMDFDIPLPYLYPTGLSIEFACKEEFKKIRKHNGTLSLYSDMAHGGRRVNVGDYEYWWDKEKDMPMARFNYDKEKILSLVPKDSEIAQRLNAGLTPGMSTEYFADTKMIKGKKMQYNYRNIDGDNVFTRIAIVNGGNCKAPFCNFEEEVEE